MSETHDRERLCRGYFYRDANLPYILGVPPPAARAAGASTIGTHARARRHPSADFFPPAVVFCTSSSLRSRPRLGQWGLASRAPGRVRHVTSPRHVACLAAPCRSRCRANGGPRVLRRRRRRRTVRSSSRPHIGRRFLYGRPGSGTRKHMHAYSFPLPSRFLFAVTVGCFFF